MEPNVGNFNLSFESQRRGIKTNLWTKGFAFIPQTFTQRFQGLLITYFVDPLKQLPTRVFLGPLFLMRSCMYVSERSIA